MLDEQQALGDSDRPTGRLEARTGIRGAAIQEAAIGPTGEVDDIEVVRPIPGPDEADEGRGAPGAHTAEAEADDRSVYKVLATRRASTLERELNAAAAVGYRLQTLTWRVGGGAWGFLPLPGDRREMMAIVARTARPARFSYRVVAARDEAESELERTRRPAGRRSWRRGSSSRGRRGRCRRTRGRCSAAARPRAATSAGGRSARRSATGSPRRQSSCAFSLPPLLSEVQVGLRLFADTAPVYDAQGRSGRRGFWRAPGWASSSCLPDSASRSPSTWRTTSPAECVCTPAPVSGSDGRRAGIP